MNNFEMATRKKYRFPFRGMVSVEDLWDLSQEQLNEVYKTIKKAEKEVSEEGLINYENDVDSEIRTKLEIVKFIFDAKKAEDEARKVAAENARKNQRILEIIDKKRNDALNDMSEEELLSMIEDVN